jgi:membrane dipeptidase
MDGHEDAIFYAQEHGGPHQFDAGWPGAQLDLPGLHTGQVDASFWAVFIPGEVRVAHEPALCVAEVDAAMAGYRTWLDGHPAYRLIYNAANLEAVVAGAAQARAGHPAPFGVLLHCEGARGIAGLEHLRALYAQGLRSVGLTWNRANAYATGVEGDPETGLTPTGKDLVRELNKLRMVVDGAHLNRRGLWDVLELATAPVVVTHTACAALHRHPRNLEDDQIRAVAATGGTIGIFYANIFLAPPGTPVTLDTVLAHYDHLLELVGPEHVALGTDYGGISSGLPAGLDGGAGDLPRLYAAFAARGYSEATIAAIRGRNYRRVLSAILG